MDRVASIALAIEMTSVASSVNFVDENYDEKYSLTTFFP